MKLSEQLKTSMLYIPDALIGEIEQLEEEAKFYKGRTRFYMTALLLLQIPIIFGALCTLYEHLPHDQSTITKLLPGKTYECGNLSITMPAEEPKNYSELDKLRAFPAYPKVYDKQ